MLVVKVAGVVTVPGSGVVVGGLTGGVTTVVVGVE
jgi:hypothetical protein